MKKLTISFMLLCAFLVVLSGCGKSEESGSKSGSESKDKTLRIVTNAEYAPMEYRDKDEIKGFDVDLIKAVAKEAGYKVTIDHVGWDPMMVEVKDKRADLAIGAITINEERKQSYEFTVPYFLASQKILVPKGSPIKSAADLKGKYVAVQGGTTGMIVSEKLLGKNSKYVKKFENNNLAIMELNKGGADAVVADNAVVEEYAKNNPKDKLVVIEDKGTFESEFYGFMFPKGETKLKDEFDKALNTLFDNGEYAKIYQDWFGNEPDVAFLKEQQK
ncbi:MULTISPECIES: basic amino acid ABC transporter substrate-binding protein [Bacillus]|uniref:basic amino acid ABC transporter substrate-binding protein n=1 Tax=Bacillus TaxID=1386 RepID=UPI00031CD238|nr:MULTISPECIES: basic amino acid ABC transporter substrate-binding protein [Bacillus]